jgi:hypothetical protein
LSAQEKTQVVLAQPPPQALPPSDHIHFAALERPEDLVTEIREFFRPLRG